MTMLIHRVFLTGLALVVVSTTGSPASGADFTVKIFDLGSNRRNGQVVTVTITPVDAAGNVVVDPGITFDADLANATSKNVDTGLTVVRVNNAQVRAVTFTFTGAGLLRTDVQRLRNAANLAFDVAVPKDPCAPVCVPQRRSKCGFLFGCFGW